MTSLRKIPGGVNLCTRDQGEQLLHADSLIGEYCNGDVDVFPPELWPAWTDDWRWETCPPTDKEAADTLDYLAECDRLAEDLDDFEHEDEVYLRDFYRMLDSIAPLPEELEVRDLGDAFLGHPD
jgi:hypothetical protein